MLRWCGCQKWHIWYGGTKKTEIESVHAYLCRRRRRLLFHWTVRGPVMPLATRRTEMYFIGLRSYWMITDFWNETSACTDQTMLNSGNDRELFLDTRDVEAEDELSSVKIHADIEVQGDRAFIFYFHIRLGFAPKQYG